MLQKPAAGGVGRLYNHVHAMGVTRVVAKRNFNVPADDRFQIFTEHGPESLIIDRTYLGIERSAECMIIQVVLNEGRTTELKKAFYKAIADGLHERLKLRKQDVFISLIEVKKENWSFGNGEAQYA